MGTTGQPSDEVRRIVDALTLEEKVALGSGGDFWHTEDLSSWGVPAAMLSDGPSGVRRQLDHADALGIADAAPATCFPAAVTLAASFDPALAERVGRAIGEEALALGVGVVLGPGANIKRQPLCGRNFEYFSEDPLVAGSLAAGWIRGVEATGAQACVKHFACNNQEYRRLDSDSVVDMRALREIYLASFERAVVEGRPSCVMSAYNRLNGVPCSQNRWLLEDVLRREWGFQGAVVTDWGGMLSRTASYQTGCDLVMPGGSALGEREAVRAVRAGELAERDVDESCARVVTLMVRARDALARPAPPVDHEAHHLLARDAACAGAVLMKNDGVLPLEGVAREQVLFVGDMARRPRYQGSGSSHINPRRLVSPVEACPEARWVPGCDERGDTTDERVAEAVRAARTSDAVVVFAGLPTGVESEGFDRDSLAMPAGANRLIAAVAAANPRTVVVLMAGSVVEMPWFDDVAAVLYMGLAGEAVGEAASRLLFGEAEPGGRLAETWVGSLADCPAAADAPTRDVRYGESVFVGYRYTTTAGVRPRLPFGFGLGYTTFSYEGVVASWHGEELHVEVTVANTGRRAGSEVVQLYVAPPEGSVFRPARELRGFSRVTVGAGERARVRFVLPRRAFAVWDGAWRVPAGRYTIIAALNSADAGVDVAVEVPGEPLVLAPPAPWYAHPVGRPPARDVACLLGPERTPEMPRRGSFTMGDTMSDMAGTSRIMRVARWAVEHVIAWRRGGPPDYADPDFRMQVVSAVDAPLASLAINSEAPAEFFEALLALANGRVLSAVRLALSGAGRLARTRLSRR